MKQQIKRIAGHLLSFSRPGNGNLPTKTEPTPDATKPDGQIFTSNVLRGTNPDLPPQTACQGQAAPETPAPTETKPARRNRDCRMKIRFTEAELADVKRKAAEAGLDRSKYIRAKMNAAKVTPAPTADATAFRAEVNRVGRRIDDIRTRTNVTGFIDTPELRKTLDEHHVVC